MPTDDVSCCFSNELLFNPFSLFSDKQETGYHSVPLIGFPQLVWRHSSSTNPVKHKSIGLFLLPSEFAETICKALTFHRIRNMDAENEYFTPFMSEKAFITELMLSRKFSLRQTMENKAESLIPDFTSRLAFNFKRKTVESRFHSSTCRERSE